jgi:hypothetical protein
MDPLAVEYGFYFGLVDSLHLINRHHSNLVIICGVNHADLQTDDNDLPLNVELVGGVRMVIFF